METLAEFAEEALQYNLTEWQARGMHLGILKWALPIVRVLRRVMPDEAIQIILEELRRPWRMRIQARLRPHLRTRVGDVQRSGFEWRRATMKFIFLADPDAGGTGPGGRRDILSRSRFYTASGGWVYTTPWFSETPGPWSDERQRPASNPFIPADRPWWRRLVLPPWPPL